MCVSSVVSRQEQASAARPQMLRIIVKPLRNANNEIFLKMSFYMATKFERRGIVKEEGCVGKSKEEDADIDKEDNLCSCGDPDLA